MICNKKLQSLFDAALRATELPQVKQNLSPPPHAPPAGDGPVRSVEDGWSQTDAETARSAVKFAPPFWKAAP